VGSLGQWPRWDSNPPPQLTYLLASYDKRHPRLVQIPVQGQIHPRLRSLLSLAYC